MTVFTSHPFYYVQCYIACPAQSESANQLAANQCVFWHAGVVTVEFAHKWIPEIINLTADSCFRRPSGMHTRPRPSLAQANHLVVDVKIKGLRLEKGVWCVRAAAKKVLTLARSGAPLKCTALIKKMEERRRSGRPWNHLVQKKIKKYRNICPKAPLKFERKRKCATLTPRANYSSPPAARGEKL